ncbi:hypothetical protein Rsub_12290 [Raphidocelis subcapitata]|uniref:Uncharacterized protein n=1 Tax=Raphidocelis subcapitata TaxID=307507 RepID=A0A2V0PKF8_9CHLO|nr:hypothetical protein Rsub_12290 [Raphidocelis subcapitata]|eukprot:GBF99512.1 hypothetical protein Rsub_12290 [Raphidocelis subcapitata]
MRSALLGGSLLRRALAARGLRDGAGETAAAQGRTYSASGEPLRTDVAIVGAGHNALVAALLLARQGLRVDVFEAAPVVGGACRTEHPFQKVPGLGHSTGGRYLLFGSDRAAMRDQFVKFFSKEDWQANEAMQAEISAIRDDVAPSWLRPPLSLEETAEAFVRPALRGAFLELCRQPAAEYVAKFGFKSDLLKVMYAVTDGFSGLNGGWDTPGTGLNFLAHNMCRLPGSDGTWMVVEGGMGTVTQQLAAAAIAAGARIRTSAPVASIEAAGGAAAGVVLADGTRVAARAVVGGCDPFRLRELAGASAFPPAFNARLDGMRKDGTTMKVNLALKALPTFKCLPQPLGQHGTTTHLLPDESEVVDVITQGFRDVQEGRLPEFPTIEWYFHTTVDPSVQDPAGHHSSALFVQWVPFELAGTTWEAEEARYVDKLLAICDRFAPGTSDLVADTFTLTPPKIESYFGITRGHIHHVDNGFGFDQRFPYRTPMEGLYSASAGTHPAGSVIGAAGHNCAAEVVRDLGLKPHWATA